MRYPDGSLEDKIVFNEGGVSGAELLLDLEYVEGNKTHKQRSRELDERADQSHGQPNYKFRVQTDKGSHANL
jgi:hypothetical protein